MCQTLISSGLSLISLYVHIPYCLSKCPYCDFFSVGWGEAPLPERDFLKSLDRETERWSHWLLGAETAGTLFFGGGTPSLLSARTVEGLLESTRRFFPWYDSIEVTLEMNPKTADPKKLQDLRRAGVNRISMGVQSLEDSLLKILGRAHSRKEALESLEWVLAAGFDSCNVDLMYGLPDQTEGHLGATLETLAAYPLPHLSAYELILEEDTPFFERYRYEAKPLPEGETVLAMRTMVEDFARGQGMQRYEISNFARPGNECRHNLAYWNYDSFVGLGPSAVSFLRLEQLSGDFFRDFPLPREETPPYGVRLTNPRESRPRTSKRAEAVSVEWISRETAALEYFMLGLRKAQGICLQDFVRRFSQDPPAHFAAAMAVAQSRGWMEFSGSRTRLTPQGVVMSNEVIQLLMD